MSKSRKIKMWIYFTLLVVALLIVVVAVHFSRTRELSPQPGTGTLSMTSSQSCEVRSSVKTATITFYMLTLREGQNLSLATVSLTSTVENTATQELIKVAIGYLAHPPVEITGMYPVLPIGTKVKNVVIKDGVAYIDFSKEILYPRYPSATSESLALCAIANIPALYGINSTFITVEGKASGPIDGKRVEDFWGHVGIYDQPLHPCR